MREKDRSPATACGHVRLRTRAWQIAGLYALFATLWIYFSDQALELLLRDPELMLRWSVYKGLGFVVITSVLLLMLMRQAFGTIEGSYAALQATEQQLRASEERLANIIATATDAMLTLDDSRRVVLFNAAAERMFQCEKGEALDQPLDRFIPTGLDLKEGRCGIAASGLRKDGSSFPIEASLSHVDIGERSLLTVIVRDVSQRRMYEIEIERSKQLHAMLSQISQAIVWTSTREELFPKVCKILVQYGGFRLAWIAWSSADRRAIYPLAAWGEEGESIDAIKVFTESLPEALVACQEASAECLPWICHDVLEDGSLQPWHSEARRLGLRAFVILPVRDGSQACGWLGIHADVSGYFQDREMVLIERAATDLSFALGNFAKDAARQQAEQAVRHERDFTAAVLSSLPGVLYLYDENGRFLRWNQNFERVTGYSATEVASMHPLDFFDAADRAIIAARINDVFERGESSSEAFFVSKDGTHTPYHFTGTRTQIDGQTCLVGVGMDISDRKRTDDLIAESERKYRELVELANSIILRWNSEGRITFLNEFGQTFFGYTAEEILGRHVIGTIVPESDTGGRDLQTLMDQICADPKAFEQNVNENIRRNGQRVEIAWTNRIVRDERGQVVEILSVGTDITERRRAEQEIRELNASLEHRVAERTAELAVARDRAESADRIKSAFLANMSHELRTPLNSIIGFTGIVLQGLAGPLNEEQTKQLGMVRTSARHLLELINDVLDISKIEAGQLEVRSEPFDLKVSIERVTALVAPQADKKGLTLRTSVADGVGVMTSDRRRVEQILLNLINNAIKFTDHGSISLNAELLPKLKLEAGFGIVDAVRISVVDTGIGISPENLAMLFQPFRQVDQGLARQHEGTGLGLAICRRLATLLHGQIFATSDGVSGSTFTVILPLQKPPTV